MHILLIGNVDQPDKNAFHNAEAELRSKGHSVINPIKEFTLSMNDNAYFMQRYLDYLCSCNAVYFLDDFKSFKNHHVLYIAAKALRRSFINSAKMSVHFVSGYENPVLEIPEYSDYINF